MINSIKPYSKNIVFWDTEFNGNNVAQAELLSLGMITIDGKELYIELEFNGDYDPWVEENVVPYLKDKKIDKVTALLTIKDYIKDTKPYLMSFISPFDFVYLSKLINFQEIKQIFHWPPLDFGSVLFGNSLNPESYYASNKDNFFQEIGIDITQYNLHNALDDAKLLRDVYLKMIHV